MTAPLVDSPNANKFHPNAKLGTWHNVWFGDRGTFCALPEV